MLGSIIILSFKYTSKYTWYIISSFTMLDLHKLIKFVFCILLLLKLRLKKKSYNSFENATVIDKH